MTQTWRDDRIGSAERGENPMVLARMKSGFAVIGDTQFLPGWGVLLASPRAERLAAGRSATVGIGVGLGPDYGPAQRMYVLRGYVPDGAGSAWRGRPVGWGDSVTVNDDFLLHLVKAVA